MKSIWLAILLAACAAPGPTVPDEARSCPHTAIIPAAPPAIRSAARLAKFAVDLELSREAGARDLAECDRRRAMLLRLLEEK